MKFDFPKREQRIIAWWKEHGIFEKLRRKNRGKKRWSFLDGPITANNPMGVHHAWGRTYKDLFLRYKAMQGFDLRFQNGFDCQGLWVEVEVEKELGFRSKKDIEKFGIAKFVEACKQRVLKYAKIQTEQSIRLGQWMDWENSYYTMSDENNYAIWGFLKKCWKQGLLYKGRDGVPWCMRCGTAISQHEILTEEYQEVTHASIVVKLPIAQRSNTFLLAWTTTPWTLPGNVALAVHPTLLYAEVKDKSGNTFVLLKEKASFVPGGTVVKEFPGRKLEHVEYQGMFDEFPTVKEHMGKEKHRVILWDEISEQEGTGVVHVAPGCGQEDFQLSKTLKLPVIDVASGEGRYGDGFGFLAGKLVTKVNDSIFDYLKKKDFVFKIEDYVHRYPTCWRCKSELIFRAVDEWYIAMEKLRKPLMKVAKSITWIPSFGLSRELDWLLNMDDWLISKKRYWGLALPIYECEACGTFEVIGSKEELKKRAVSGWKQFEGNSPHRPSIDKVKIKCSQCHAVVSRIPDVGSPWLDAGIVPFSTMGYYTNKAYWKKWFPADFITEAFSGQFRNWFYTLIVMSTVLEDTSPVRTIFGHASVRDDKGEEMHKSKGNAIWFDEAVEKIGADPMRWMYAKQNPAYNLQFGWQGAEEIKRKLLTLHNAFLFFCTYVPKKEMQRQEQSKSLLDKWIVTRLHTLIDTVTKHLDDYNPAGASRAIEHFFVEDLSLWYIRRSRKRFHEDHPERKDAAGTLYYVLGELLKLIAPIMPFFAEDWYQQLRSSSMPESVHLCDWPKPASKKINKELEKDMDAVRRITAQILAARAEAGIKVRQPLQKATITKKLEVTKKELVDIIREEVNVKEIVFARSMQKEVLLDTTITKELKEEGMVREIVRSLQQMRKEAGLQPKERISVFYKDSSILAKHKDSILKEVGARDLTKGEEQDVLASRQIKVDKETLWIGIKKI